MLRQIEHKALKALADGQPRTARWLASTIQISGNKGKASILLKGLAMRGFVARMPVERDLWTILDKGRELV